jgi:cell division protein ZapA (FtsZ GTPase activity inhibitor)
MYSKTVTIDGRQYAVMCCPDTPDHQVLERAAAMARERKE